MPRGKETKFSTEQLMDIFQRLDAKESVRSISRSYNVHRSVIDRIKKAREKQNATQTAEEVFRKLLALLTNEQLNSCIQAYEQKKENGSLAEMNGVEFYEFLSSWLLSEVNNWYELAREFPREKFSQAVAKIPNPIDFSDEKQQALYKSARHCFQEEVDLLRQLLPEDQQALDEKTTIAAGRKELQRLKARGVDFTAYENGTYSSLRAIKANFEAKERNARRQDSASATSPADNTPPTPQPHHTFKRGDRVCLTSEHPHGTIKIRVGSCGTIIDEKPPKTRENVLVQFDALPESFEASVVAIKKLSLVFSPYREEGLTQTHTD